MMYYALALQKLVRSFEKGVDTPSKAALFDGQFIAGPVLLTLSMELALKAWWAKENKDNDVPKSHDLLKLFDGLNEDTRTRLETAHPEVPNPYRGLPPIRSGLRSTLASNRSVFVEWRYLHELSSAWFPEGEFDEALSSVIGEFYRAAS